jgi:hypothetical protein
MAKKKEATTEEEMIAELQKQIDAYNKKINGGKKPKPGTMTPVKPGGNMTKPLTPGEKTMKPLPIKPVKPKDPIKYIQPVKPGAGKPGGGKVR